MFSPIGSVDTALTIFLDDQPVPARAGESVAACLLRAGVGHFRKTPVSNAPRAPFCMIGHCFECLVEIEGLGSRQACLLQVADGMRIHRQQGAATIMGLGQS